MSDAAQEGTDDFDNEALPKYEYKMQESQDPLAVATFWGNRGWRLVSMIQFFETGFLPVYKLMFERVKPVEKPIDTTKGSIEDPDLSRREREFRYGE